MDLSAKNNQMFNLNRRNEILNYHLSVEDSIYLSNYQKWNYYNIVNTFMIGNSNTLLSIIYLHEVKFMF